MGILKSDRVLLRPIERRDLACLNRWKNDENVYQFLGGGFAPVSIDVQQKWLDDLMDTTGADRRLMIENEKGRAIGMVGLYHINWVHRTCDLGVFIGDQDQRHLGYASAACILLEQYACQFLNMRKIKAAVVKSNAPAVALYQKLHYQQVGCLAQERFIAGRYHDLLMMEKFLNQP